MSMLLAGCPQSQQASTAAAICQPTQGWCDLIGADGTVGHGRWQVQEPIIASEQELHFIIELDTSVQTASGTVSGVNMAMGTMPLFIDRIVQHRIEGRLLLPACTNERMHWQARLQLNDNNGAIILQTPVFESSVSQ